MMDDSYLDVTTDYVDHCKITQMQYHSFTQYSTRLFHTTMKLE